MVDRFQHWFDNLKDEVVVVDRDLRITYANPAWLKHAGLLADSVVGHKCQHVLSDSTTRCAPDTCELRQVFGEQIATAAPCPRLTHQAAPTRVSLSPVHDEEGTVTEVVQIVRPPAASAHDEGMILHPELAHDLREVSLMAAPDEGLQAVLDALLDQLGRVVSFDSASIALADEEGWHIIAGAGHPRGVVLDGLTFPPQDGKLARLRETHKPLIIADVREDPSWCEVEGLDYVRSWMGAPLIVRGRIIGALNLDKATTSFYQPEDAELVMAFANHAAVVLENARLLDSERTRSVQLRLLRDLSERILTILDREALLDYSVAAIQKQFGYYHVDVFLVDASGEYMVFGASSHGENAACWRDHGLRFRIGEEGITGHVAATGQPYLAGEVSQEPRYVCDILLPETCSELAVPIKASGRVIGVLDLNSDRPRAFDVDDLFVAQSLADLLALGLENARLYETAKQRVAELEAIRQASLSLTSSLRLPQVLESILQTTLDLLPVAKNTHIFLHEDGKLRFGAARWADGRTGTPWATPRSHGLTHTVARSGDLLVVPDMQAHPLFEDAPAEWQGAIIGLPLKISQRVVGVMSIAYQEGHAISEAELRALGLLADQAALAVENARLFAAERQTRLELQSIQTTATALGTELDLETLPGKIVEEAARAFRAEAASVMLWDEREQSLTIRAGTGLSQAYLDQQRIARERAYQVIGDGSGTVEPFYIENLLERPLGIGELIEQEGLVSVLIIPLLLQGEFIGTLNIYSRGERRHFTPGEIDLAQTFAGHAAVAIENARLLAAEARRRREAETLQTATQALAATRDLQQVLQVILTELRQVVPYDSATVQRLEDGLLEIIGGAGFPNIDDLLGVLFDVTASDNPNRQVVESRAPVILHDAPAVYGRFEQEPHAQASIRSWLGVPLLFGDRLIGMLALDKQEPGFYNAEHARLVMAFAAQAAIATENVRLYQETRQRLKELALLFDTSADLSTTLDVDRVALLTARHITAALNVRGCTISLWYAKEHEMVTLLDYSPNMEGWKDKEPGTVYDLDQYPESYRVLNERCPVVVLAGDPDADPAELAWMQDSDVKSVLMVPMVVRDKAIGLLELIESDREREFTETDISLSQTLANQAAAALDNARLFHETEMRAQEMAALAAVGQALRSLELDEILDLVAENALQAARAEISSVYLLDEEKQVLVPRSVRGIQKEELEQASFHLGEGTIGQVAESGESLIVQDISQSLTFAVKTNAARQIRNTLTVPLAAKERVIGTLEVCNKVNGDKFTEDDRRLLDAFAAQAAAAIENARLYQELSHHLEDVQILNKVANAVTSTLDFDMMLRRGMQALIGTRNFERVNILLLDEEKNDLWLHPALTVNWTFPPRADIRIPLGTGISGRVAESGQPIRVADVRIEPNYVAGYADTMSEICVPLRVGNRVIGVLDVQSRCVGAFSADDERLLTTVAGQFSTVIENSRLFAETRQRVRELTALMQASRALNEAQDLDTILDIVLEEAFSLIGSHEGSVILIDPPGSNQLRIVAERGLGQAVIDSFNERPVHTHEGTYRRALETGKLIEVHDTSADADFLTDVGSQAKSVTNIPLLIDRGPIGLIAVDGVPGDDTTRRLLTALAGMAAVAIDKERLHQETAHRLSEVSTLYTLSTQITTSLVLGPVLDSIVAILRMTLDCRSCSIFLLDQAGEYLRLEAGSGPSASWRGIARMRLGEGISGRVVAERRSIYVPDTRAESDFLFFDPQIRSLLVVPLIVRNQVIGTLSIDDTQAHAFDDEMRLLTIAAAQAAVAIENAQLYESLQESYSELEQAYDELRELDKMKSELIQNISHELRTPLTFIKGYVELLLDGEMGPVDEEQRMALEIVDNKSEVLSNLLDDIISMQQASREQLQLQPLSLAELAQTEIRSAHPSAQEAGVALKQEIPETVPDVLADRRRMGQVFDNLLQNAIKFSNPGGSIVVRVLDQPDSIRVEVEDTGIGIPADQLTRIFERFYQVDGTTTRRFGGTGLGLAIVKQIVEGHGGQVGVRSALDKGSLFYFTIPKASVS